MNKIALASAAALSIGACAHAARTSKAPPASSPEAEVIALDDAWVAAEVGHDKAALERILDEDFLATFNSGETVDRGAYIDYIMQAEIEPFTVRHDSIRVHGDTALVLDLSESGKTKFTWIAVKRDGRWRVISETFTKVASAASE